MRKLQRRTEVVGEFPNTWERTITLKTNNRKAYIKNLLEGKKRYTRVKTLSQWHNDRAWMRCVKVTNIKIRDTR